MFSRRGRVRAEGRGRELRARQGRLHAHEARDRERVRREGRGRAAPVELRVHVLGGDARPTCESSGQGVVKLWDTCMCVQ